ncbi:uncharacterized protein Z520_01613 [Fonsecaea multimorphosa CBS 102226]|uniref:Uncharacterized protein n=1 Tax=Fonsecaea multimorphosa CBS 102226 TaxID=1442371 RepID=A0A0D2HMP6_9EURO|nr:uncharacterized protein Z520_01613 [Fonsecaea multimorphosa CBS 102226]KIY03146.1 hypothetical protein Z520_01613 [Fonsecaea multimorphosa CBS 102226]
MSQTAWTVRQERRVLQVRKKRTPPRSQKRILPSTPLPENDAKHKGISSAYVEKLEEHANDLSTEAHRTAVARRDGRQIERRSHPELRLLTGSPILTQRHLSLIQNWLTNVVPRTWGSSGTKFFGATFILRQCLQHSDVAALWLAIMSEESIFSLSGQPRTKEMMLQKAAGRRALMSTLQEARSNFGGAVLALTKAAQVALWYGDQQAHAVYSAAADLLFSSVGGLSHACALAPDIEPHYLVALFHWTAPRIANAGILEHTTRRLLVSIQTFLQLPQPEHLHMLRDDGESSSSNIHHHHTLHIETIGLFAQITAPTANSTTASRILQVVLLTHLCGIHEDFQDNYHAQLEAFQAIRYHFFSSFKAQSTLEQSHSVQSMSGLACYVRRQLLTKYIPEQRFACEVRYAQTLLDIAKVFPYMSPGSQVLILGRLHASFSGERAGSMILSNSEIDGIVTDAVQNWTAQQRQHGATGAMPMRT